MTTQRVHAVVYKDAESDQWVAQCLEYDVSSQGDSVEHALEMIREAVELYLEDAGQTDLELLYQEIDGEPQIHDITVDAPSLLHR